MLRLGCVALMALAVAISLPASRGQLVTQLFSDAACANLLSSPIPRAANECVADLFTGTWYQTEALDSIHSQFTIGVSYCTFLSVSRGECATYGGASIKVEVAVQKQALNASLFDSATCTSLAAGYGSVSIMSGECTAGTSNGIFATLIEQTDTTPDVIVSLACSTDCSSCGFYARGKPDECIVLPQLLPLFYGKVSLVSAAEALALPIFLLVILAVALHL